HPPDRPLRPGGHRHRRRLGSRGPAAPALRPGGAHRPDLSVRGKRQRGPRFCRPRTGDDPAPRREGQPLAGSRRSAPAHRPGRRSAAPSQKPPGGPGLARFSDLPRRGPDHPGSRLRNPGPAMSGALLHWQAIWLTLKLAAVTTAVLLVLATPLAWWLARTSSRLKQPVAALCALPLVLPPTVLGFYLLVLMGPQGPVGQFTQWLGIGTLPFTFAGLVVASTIYSLPFALQPLQTAFEGLGERPLEVAATLRAGPWDRAVHVVLPLARNGMLSAAALPLAPTTGPFGAVLRIGGDICCATHVVSAAVLAFAHTIGEFGVVLMIGGTIPGATQVLSVAIFNHVEAMEYVEAHWLAGCMVVFSFLVLLALYAFNQRGARIGVGTGGQGH